MRIEMHWTSAPRWNGEPPKLHLDRHVVSVALVVSSTCMLPRRFIPCHLTRPFLDVPLIEVRLERRRQLFDEIKCRVLKLRNNSITMPLICFFSPNREYYCKSKSSIHRSGQRFCWFESGSRIAKKENDRTWSVSSSGANSTLVGIINGRSFYSPSG